MKGLVSQETWCSWQLLVTSGESGLFGRFLKVTRMQSCAGAVVQARRKRLASSTLCRRLSGTSADDVTVEGVGLSHARMGAWVGASYRGLEEARVHGENQERGAVRGKGKAVGGPFSMHGGLHGNCW